MIVDDSIDEDLTAADRLAAELRTLRDLTGKSLRELEKSTHTSDSSLSRYLSGQALPPWPVVEALATAAGRDTERLRTLWSAARQTRNRKDGPPDDNPPGRPVMPRRPRWAILVAAAIGILVGAAIQPGITLIAHRTGAANPVTSGPYFTVDLLATPPGSAQRVLWTDTARCGSAQEYRLTYDLPAAAQRRATAYRLVHADCTVKLFDGLSGTGYGEIFTPDNAIHDLSARITGIGVSIVAYSCCNGTVVN